MAQLNIHIPDSSSLFGRVEQYAQELGVSSSTLARSILEFALEPYVQARLQTRALERQQSAAMAEALRSRLSDQAPSQASEPAPERVAVAAAV